MTDTPKHVVAIIGGAVAGSEAAKAFAEAGIGVVVFDRNERPYGKIEEGLPRWHDKMRLAEFERIDEVYRHPLVTYVPKTRIGESISFCQLVKEWGFSAVVLANGAWRDRPLGIDQINAYQGRGFYYQNPFMYWFNHSVEKDYAGPQCEVHEGGIVVGGGLASIDVVKVLMLEAIQRALVKRGIEVDINTLERRGADKILEEHHLKFDDLNVKPCTLYYRRQLHEMPLVAYPENATEEQKQKTEKTRSVLLNRAMSKYFFKVQELRRPVSAIIENDRVAGLKFVRTKVENGRMLDEPGSEHEVRAPITISSIGSLPEPMQGVPAEGELYVWRDGNACRLKTEREVYGLGNVVTGRGNIAVSRKHSKEISEKVIANIASLPPLVSEQRDKLFRIIAQRQQEVGYDGNYDTWIKSHPPLEHQEGKRIVE